MRFLVLIVAVLCAPVLPAVSQQVSVAEKIADFPSKVIDKVNHKASRLENKLVSQTQKYLQRLAKLEARLKKKLSEVDSADAQQLFSVSAAGYSRLQNSITDTSLHTIISTGKYFPNIDSLKTSLSFLDQNSNLFSAAPGKIKEALANVRQLQSKLQDAEQVKQFIRQRSEQLKETLSKYSKFPGISKELQRFNKEAYYYSQQVREYKELLNDPHRLEQKALSLLNKLPAFQEFMKKHSELAGLFGTPDMYNNPQSLVGLQTRQQVQQLLQAQLSVAGPNAQQVLQQNIQQAQAQLDQLKDKLLKKLGNGDSDMDVPDFKPNNQRTKSFWKRLEYGANFQSVKSNSFFPTTTDIGLSLGYKLNDKSVIGIGASYKMGWGKEIRHINITHQGAGIRSFIDIQLNGSFYASAGYEQDYQPVTMLPAQQPVSLGEASAWQQSGLIGVSKVVSMKSKLFKKTKVQLLWNFLSYQQTPRTQAIKFRIGYQF